MTQVSSITNQTEQKLNSESNLNFEKREEIVHALVEQGLPTAFSPSNFINRIAKNNDISAQEARECLKEAIEQLEARNKEKANKINVNNEEQLNAKSGYFYPRDNKETSNAKNDGMDSLVAFASFQRLRFGLQ